MMMIKSDFKPAWWLPGPHLQTLWPVVARSQINIPLEPERVSLFDGDFVDLHWSAPREGPLVLILHGLGGSYRSHYIQGVVQELEKNHYQVVVMNFRGSSGEANIHVRSYHSGETEDAAYVASLLKSRFPEKPLYAIGYSLGGNMLLKWLGESQNDNPIDAAVAVSSPLELHKAATKMSRVGLSRIYQWYLIRELKSLLALKHENDSLGMDYDVIKTVKNFWQLDDVYTAPIHGFEDAKDYYTKSSSRQYLKSITKPTLVIHAKDDPFVDETVVPSDDELSDSVTFELSKRGGHVGFVTGQIPGQAEYWLESRISQFLNSHVIG